MSEIEAPVKQPEPNRSAPRNRRFRRQRNNLVRQSMPIWYPDEEYKLVHESAKLCGKPTATFIREASLGMPLKAEPFLANAELVRELSQSGVAVVRLMAIARETGALSVADRMEKVLQELRALIKVALAEGTVITIRRRD